MSFVLGVLTGLVLGAVVALVVTFWNMKGPDA